MSVKRGLTVPGGREGMNEKFVVGEYLCSRVCETVVQHKALVNYILQPYSKLQTPKSLPFHRLPIAQALSCSKVAECSLLDKSY